MNLPQFFFLCLAGWIHRNQQHVFEYLQEEVKVLKEQLGKKPRLQRRKPLYIRAPFPGISESSSAW